VDIRKAYAFDFSKNGTLLVQINSICICIYLIVLDKIDSPFSKRR
jgi:hypothetical protein